MSDLDPEIAATMSTLLGLSDIAAGDSDLPGLQKAFVSARENAALVFGVAEARYESPALVFRAAL